MLKTSNETADAINEVFQKREESRRFKSRNNAKTQSTGSQIQFTSQPFKHLKNQSSFEQLEDIAKQHATQARDDSDKGETGKSKDLL